MNSPRQPRLPKVRAEPPYPDSHPLHRPDERKEGGPDFGKAEKQHENRNQAKEEARKEAQ